MHNVYVIMLAAGNASRFGGPKQCEHIQGMPMLSRSIGVFSHLGRVTCVLGAYQAQINATLPQDQKRVIAHDWQAGMSASIRAGLTAVPDDATHICIALADQVAITVGDVALLRCATKAQPDRIVAAAYNDVVGAPAIFPIQYQDDLSGLEGDRGARALLTRHADQVNPVAIPAASQDIDTKADLAAWLATGTYATDQQR